MTAPQSTPLLVNLEWKIGANSLWLQRKTFCKEKPFVKKSPVKFYYSSHFVTIKIIMEWKWEFNNIKFVVILIRFLGTCALPFCDFFVFAEPIQLVHCDTCSTQVKPRRSEVPRYLVSGEKYAVHGFTVSARVEHVSQRTSCTGPAKQNGSVHVPQNRMSITTNSV